MQRPETEEKIRQTVREEMAHRGLKEKPHQPPQVNLTTQIRKPYPHPPGPDGKLPRVRLRCDNKPAGSMHMLIDPTKRLLYMVVYLRPELYHPGRSYTGFPEGGVDLSAIRLPGSEVYTIQDQVWKTAGTVEVRQGRGEYVSLQIDKDAPEPKLSGASYEMVATNPRITSDISNALWLLNQLRGATI